MKHFWKYTLATITGVVITSIVGFFIMMGIFGAIASSSEAPVKIKSASIYELELKGQLVDRAEDDPFSDAVSSAMGQEAMQIIGLDYVLLNIQTAKNETLVKGIYLNGVS